MRFPRGRRRVGLAVGGRHAEIVLAVGQDIGVEGERVIVGIALEQQPLGFVFAAEVEVVDQAVAIGVLGLPGDGDLLGGGARQSLGGSARGSLGAGVGRIGNGDAVRGR